MDAARQEMAEADRRLRVRAQEERRQVDGNRAILLAYNSKTCSVPPNATFEQTDGNPVAMPLSKEGSKWFASRHCRTVFVDPSTKCNQQFKIGARHVVHCYKLHQNAAQAINREISQLAVNYERAAESVSRSNAGGYQSDAFMLDADSEPSDTSRAARQMHAVLRMVQEAASAAVGEIRGGGATSQRTGAMSGRTQLASAYAWVNVNRASDWNLIHIHEPTKLSAVYFVSPGGVSPKDSPDGHLIFRGGRATRAASHSFLAVPPEPGTLYVFPGSLPHCVFPFEKKPTAHPRISVAINFCDDLGESPPPV